MQLTEGGRRLAHAVRRGGRRRAISAGIAMLAAAGMVSGGLVAVLSGPSHGDFGATGSPPSLPRAHPPTGNAPFTPGVPLTLGSGVRLIPGSSVPAAEARTTKAAAHHPPVAPLRQTVQADLLIVAPFSLPRSLLGKVTALPGMIAAERIEAVRMRIDGSDTAVVGVDPSQFRSFAAKPTGEATALWQGVADGGIAVSYTMGKLDKIPLGGSVTATGAVTKKLPVVAFGTLGIGGVNAVMSDATARQLGAPAGNAIVVSVNTADFTADVAAIGKLLPKGAGVEQLVSLVSSGQAGAGPVTSAAAATSAIAAMLSAAMSRKGMPYVWGAEGPTSFDCSGLVQWSFAQAGIVMPRVAADQARSGPAVPVSQLQPGDLLFYHTDPTAPGYISHVAIFLGNGWMIQAPQPGQYVEVVPAAFGSEFAGAIRVSPAQAAAVARGVA